MRDPEPELERRTREGGRKGHYGIAGDVGGTGPRRRSERVSERESSRRRSQRDVGAAKSEALQTERVVLRRPIGRARPEI